MSDIIRALDVQKVPTAQGARYSCVVDGLDKSRSLYFNVSTTAEGHSLARSDDWALLSLLVLAMSAGKSLHIESAISPLLLHAARSDIQHLLRKFIPSLSPIEIEADICQNALPARNSLRIGTGFSAGVDSFAAIGSFRETGLAPAVTVTDVLVFNVGAIGRGRGGTALRAFGAIVDRARDFASITGRRAHSVDSNLQSFYTGSRALEFTRTHTVRNMAAASLFQSEIDVYLYASGISYDEANIVSGTDIANFDPALLPLLAPSGMRFISANPGLNRVAKTRLIATDELARQMLDVCVAPTPVRSEGIRARRNCSKCWKCFRTMVTLDALGQLDNFSQVFDVEHYRQNARSIIEVVRKRGAKGSAPDRAAYECIAEKSAAVLCPSVD